MELVPLGEVRKGRERASIEVKHEFSLNIVNFKSIKFRLEKNIWSFSTLFH